MVHLRRRLALLMILLLALLASLGCAAHQVREAQDAFNEAARSENAQRAVTLSGGSTLLASSSAAAGYRLSLNLLDEAIAKHEADLRGDRLYGTALVLKSLCLWRLADLDDDEAAATDLMATLARIQTERSGGTLTLGTRDRVMTEALSGLRDHDRGLRATDLDGAQESFRSSVKVLERALASEPLPGNHPVRIYLRLSQLASLRAWHAATYAFLPRTEARSAVGEIRAEASRVTGTLAAAMRFDPELSALVDRYKLAIGI